MFIYIFYFVMLENKGLYICIYFLSRNAWEQGIIYLQISFISYCLRTRDYMSAYIFYLLLRKNKGLLVCIYLYLVMLENKGLYVYLYLLFRIACEQGIIYLQISFISWCVRTRDYIFANIFYFVMRKNKGLYICKYLLFRDA